MICENLAERYSVQGKPVGQGHLSAVYKGIHPDGGRVAIKVIREERRAQQEMQIMRHYDWHPHLPALIDYGVCQGKGHLIMPFFTLPTLGHHLRGDRHSPGEVRKILGRLLSAAGHLHQHRVLHTDLHPGNVLCAPAAAKLKLIDFGAAVLTDEEGTYEVSQVKGGTWEYMAPEQFERDAQLDATTDLYAVAAIGIYLLTGRPPFTPPPALPRERYYRRCRVLRHGERRLRIDHGTFNSVLNKALHFKRSRRFQSAASFREALDV